MTSAALHTFRWGGARTPQCTRYTKDQPAKSALMTTPQAQRWDLASGPCGCPTTAFRKCQIALPKSCCSRLSSSWPKPDPCE